MSILIFANGESAVSGWEWVRRYVSNGSLLIAADGGTQHLVDLDLTPDVIIGDLDSLDPVLHRHLDKKDIKFVASSVDKDETDLELALIFAAENYEAKIRVFGASGGRLDQTLSNVLLLALPVLQGRDVKIVEPFQMAWLVDNQTSIQGRAGDLVSLLPQWGEVHVDRTEGLKWQLIEAILLPGPARGVSNIMIADTAEIYVSAGKLLCIHTYEDWNR